MPLSRSQGIHEVIHQVTMVRGEKGGPTHFNLADSDLEMMLIGCSLTHVYSGVTFVFSLWTGLGMGQHLRGEGSAAGFGLVYTQLTSRDLMAREDYDTLTHTCMYAHTHHLRQWSGVSQFNCTQRDLLCHYESE